MNLVALDVETTGVHVWRDRIVSYHVSELDQNLQVLQRHDGLVNPGIPIPAPATAVHGITDAMVADKPGFEAYADWFQDVLADAVVVGYNVQFDLNVLHQELLRAGRAGVPVDQATIDPFKVFCREHPRTLAAAMEVYCGVPIVDAHNPAADVAATLRVLKAMLGRRGDGDLGFFIEDGEDGFLDRSRRFRRGPSDEVVFAFGKYAGEPAKAHPGYLEWMLREDFAMDSKCIAQDLLREVYA